MSDSEIIYPCAGCGVDGNLICPNCDFIDMCSVECWNKIYPNHRKFCEMTIHEIVKMLQDQVFYNYYGLFFEIYLTIRDNKRIVSRELKIDFQEILYDPRIQIRIQKDHSRITREIILDNEIHNLHKRFHIKSFRDYNRINQFRIMFYSFIITESTGIVSLKNFHSIMNILLEFPNRGERSNVFEGETMISSSAHFSDMISIDYDNMVYLIQIYDKNSSRSIEDFFIFQSGGHIALIRPNFYFTFLENYLVNIGKFLENITKLGHHRQAFKDVIRFNHAAGKLTSYDYKFIMLDIDSLQYT